MVIPRGCENRAALPRPSSEPLWPAWPATVVTTPAGETFRMTELSRSATYTTPDRSTAMPEGSLKRAALPAPSA